MYTSFVALQVKRSQRNRALEGKMFGIPYGYKIKIKNGREVTGEREIDKTKASVVLEIFTMFADGHSLGSIVQYLNAQNITSPGGKKWTKNALAGSLSRHEGILNNQIYRGCVIWNMKSLFINPETGGKNYYMNPENEWVITQHEDLRIVFDELWERCEILKQRYKKQPKRRKYLINPLLGLVFCGICSSQKTLPTRNVTFARIIANTEPAPMPEA